MLAKNKTGGRNEKDNVVCFNCDFDLQFSGIIFPEEVEDTDSDSSGYVKQHGRSDRSGPNESVENNQ